MADSERRGMGRGLSAILPPAAKGQEGLREIPVELVAEPRQPRRSFDEDALAELAESIRARGVLQPIVVRALPGGHYELVAGERRLRAARMAELETVPAVVREADDWERLDLRSPRTWLGSTSMRSRRAPARCWSTTSGSPRRRAGAAAAGLRSRT